MQLHTIWFVIISIFWIGFFVLEGFDFGVGALHTIVGRGDSERKLALSTIGPWWDGNEVWLIVAGAGMFAAFPGWYATMFSALYLALLLVLVALMARGVAFEFKDKSENPRWRLTWRWAMTIGCLLIPLLLGVGLGDLLNGLPIDSSHEYTGNFFDLLTPYGLWTGLTLLALCLLKESPLIAAEELQRALHGQRLIQRKQTAPVFRRSQILRKDGFGPLTPQEGEGLITGNAEEPCAKFLHGEPLNHRQHAIGENDFAPHILAGVIGFRHTGADVHQRRFDIGAMTVVG